MTAIDALARTGIVDTGRLLRSAHAVGDMLDAAKPLRKFAFDSVQKTLEGVAMRQGDLAADLGAALAQSDGATADLLRAAHTASSESVSSAQRAIGLLGEVHGTGPKLLRRFDASGATATVHELEAALARTDSAMHQLTDDAAQAVERARQARGAEALRPEADRILAEADEWVAYRPDGPQRRVFTMSRLIMGDSLVVAREGTDTAAGASMIIGTHGSNLDGPWLGAALHNPEPMRAMVNGKMMKVPGLGGLMKHMGGYPVDYRAPAQSIGRSRGMLARGQDVAIFPEGRFVYGPHTGEAKAGAVRIALSEGVGIKPTASYGTKAWYAEPGMGRFSPRLRVYGVGETIKIDPATVKTKADLEAAVERVWQQVDAQFQKAKSIHEELYPGFRRRTIRNRVIAGAGATVGTAGVYHLTHRKDG